MLYYEYIKSWTNRPQRYQPHIYIDICISFHCIFHVLFHLILHYWGNISMGYRVEGCSKLVGPFQRDLQGFRRDAQWRKRYEYLGASQE